MADFTLADLESIVAERGRSSAADSWTGKLFAEGMERAAKKMGEEAVETVIAAVKGEAGELVAETADLLYHLMVVLALADISLADVMAELERRTGRTGIAEKASRPA